MWNEDCRIPPPRICVSIVCDFSLTVYFKKRSQCNAGVYSFTPNNTERRCSFLTSPSSTRVNQKKGDLEVATDKPDRKGVHCARITSLIYMGGTATGLWTTPATVATAWHACNTEWMKSNQVASPAPGQQCGGRWKSGKRAHC